MCCSREAIYKRRPKKEKPTRDDEIARIKATIKKATRGEGIAFVRISSLVPPHFVSYERQKQKFHPCNPSQHPKPILQCLLMCIQRIFSTFSRDHFSTLLSIKLFNDSLCCRIIIISVPSYYPVAVFVIMIDIIDKLVDKCQ